MAARGLKTKRYEHLEILQSYSDGQLSAREAVEALGPFATQHDLFAGVIAAGLPLPVPMAQELSEQLATVQRLYQP
jgi:hypothetical protein